MDARRSQRVSEALREELAEIVGYELSDPRLASVTVTAVEVTPDLRSAQVRFLCEEPVGEADVLRALSGARQYIRRALASRMRLWRLPELRFAVDRSAEAAGRVEELLAQAEKDRKKVSEGTENSG
jgi:ribosome-binding factor A